ncbi:MAG: signal recognition particle-docking protein FtsY [Bacteroidetes bacterium]|jgi:fused signal recognition particle receptor|nr:signal recognition particle-docking protein FtsY [Bacteroidota bacterium]NBY30790.1 signal recognition particle-docking protein FtsY [Sphingobacteriia bacterium]
MGFFDFLKGRKEKEALVKGLERTKEGFFSKILRLFSGRTRIDDDLLEELEEILLSADVGVNTTVKIMSRLHQEIERRRDLKPEDLQGLLKEHILELLGADLKDEENKLTKPHVILVVGVNGVGKTTSIGKLAWRFKQAGKQVVMGAADTFRAAAVEQLLLWGERTGVRVVHQQSGSDPASVAFDTLKSAMASSADIVLIDTAGRLHNKGHLMAELSKVRTVLNKCLEGAPHEVWLVLDASTGQNAVEQAKQFTAATQVTGLILTKLDGTAKGGVAIGICAEFKLPIRFVGVGEGMEQLQVFDKEAFVDGLFEQVS